MNIVRASDLQALARLYAGGWESDSRTVERVAQIVADVRMNGDVALLDLTRQLDAPDFTLDRLRVELPSLDRARSLVPADVARALELAKERVHAFHERQRPQDVRVTEDDGTISAFLNRPLRRIGAYVPGGSAPLASTVVMTAVTARAAGVEQVVVATPPSRNGTINDAILFACRLCEVDEVYAAGGAQAIAALAYGTESIARVDKIVGPGNVWVTEAKRQVFGVCGIDSLAGPSEVLVVADGGARAEYVAGELLAQAEHDPMARVAAVSTDRRLLETVGALLDGAFARETGRWEIIESVLAKNTYLIQAQDEHEILDVIERFAPEHLALQVADPWPLVERVRHAGAIFVGDHTPVACGDYVAGSNHVLPTSGAARFSSGLRTSDFMRSMSVIANSERRMRSDAPLLAALADFEQLPAHARTARMRAEERV